MRAWDKAEAYFVLLFEQEIPSVLARIKLCDIFNTQPQKIREVTFAQVNLIDIYNLITEDSYLMKILALLLTVGNICNAEHKERQRADGFDIEFLTQVSSLKDNNKRSIL